MKRILLALVLLAAGTTAIARYGADDRHDFYDTPKDLRDRFAESSVALFDKDGMSEDGEGYRFVTKSLEEARGVCPEERFAKENAVAYCSGVLIAPDRVLTAGHCVYDEDRCRETKVVFDYAAHTPGREPRTAKAQNVYSCKRVASRGDQFDFVVLELDRPVEGHRPAELKRTGGVAPGEDVIGVGYPAGLTMKFLLNAKARKGDDEVFYASLDGYNSNSGTPVYDLRSGTLQGILIDGPMDYVQAEGRSCYVSNICPDDGCDGETILKSDAILKEYR